MSIILIIIGFSVARFGAKLFVVGEAQGGQNDVVGIITLIIQLSGWAIVIFGAVKLFS